MTLRPEGNGMALLSALIPELAAARAMNRLTAIAAGLQDPDRTLGQKRADILIDSLLANPQPGPNDTPATHQPSPNLAPEINVIIDLDTLLGLANNPGLVPGLGRISATETRDLAAHGKWRAWITNTATDATNRHLIAVGATTYTPSTALARHIRAREPECRMPGCRRRSPQCDLDHTAPWPTGTTTAANLGPLCRRHHNLKTHHGYHLQNIPGEADTDPPHWTWTTPTGITRHCQAQPPDLWA